MSTVRLTSDSYFVIDESAFVATITAFDPLIASQTIAIGGSPEMLGLIESPSVEPETPMDVIAPEQPQELPSAPE